MSKNKKRIIVFSILAIIIFLVGQHLFINLNNKEVELKRVSKVLPIKYMIVDEEKSENYNTIDEIFENADDSILNVIYAYEYLKKNNDVYENVLSNANDLLTDNVLDYIFAVHDETGTVINDAIYDPKTKKVTVPASYYENNEDMPIQLQVMVKLSYDEILNTTFKTKISDKTTKKEDVTYNGFDIQTKVTLFEYDSNRKIKKDDLKIYYNDYYEIPSRDYRYDEKAKTLTLNMTPLLINNLKINIENKSIISKAIDGAKAAINFVDATGDDVNDRMIKLSKAPSKDWVTGAEFVKNIYHSYNNVYPLKNGVWKYQGDTESVYISASKTRTPHRAFGMPTDDKNGVHIDEDGLVNVASDDTPGVLNEHYFDLKLDSSWFGSDVIFEKSDYENSTQAGGIMTGGTYMWVDAFCAHIDVSYNDNNSETINSNIRVITRNDTENFMIIQILANTSTGGQEPYGLYKLYWDNPDCDLKVKKVLTQGTFTKNSTVYFTLYKGSGCVNENKIKSYTLKLGPNTAKKTMTIKNLDEGTYSIKETDFKGLNYDNSATISLSSYYEMGKSCHNVTLRNEDGTCAANKTATITNRKKKYCVKVYKNDIETGAALSGATFTLMNEDSKVKKDATTDASGIVTFDNLTYGGKGKYSLTEVTPPNGYMSNGLWTRPVDNMYDTGNAIYLRPEDLTEMVYSNGTYTCPAEPINVIRSNRKKYYCVAVQKLDGTVQNSNGTYSSLSGAEYQINGAPTIKQFNSSNQNAVTNSDGLAFFFLGTSNTTVGIKEITAPLGFSINSNVIPATPVLMPEGTTSSGNNNDTGADFVHNCFSAVVATNQLNTQSDKKLTVNWYKLTETNKPGEGAKFRLSTTDGVNYAKVKSNESGLIKIATTLNNVTKNCYLFDSFTTNSSEASELISDSSGDVCVTGLQDGISFYTVTEIKPIMNHGNDENIWKTIQITTTDFYPQIVDNTFINYPTRFEFTKTVSSGDGDEKIVVNGVEKTLSQLTTEELKKIEFNVTDSEGNLVSFVLQNGIYEYADNTIDGPLVSDPTLPTTTSLYLNDDRKIIIQHLPSQTYFSIKEKAIVCDPNTEDGTCIGYYYPKYKNWSDSAFSTQNSYGQVAKLTLENKPTEISFTKKDFYGYEDASDIANFENDKERSDFDRIVFKLKDKNGKYLTLKKVTDHGNCKTDDSYSEYRYVYGDSSDVNGTELHTCGGHIKITNLCRGKKYTIEEISVPEDSVFVKENTDTTPTEVTYDIPCEEGNATITSTTKIISDKPTRVRFEKRDSKYGNLILDETTTFQVYKCKKGVECHPADGITSDMELVKFNKRGVITGDEEDPTDAEGYAGVEVYRRMSDSDVQSNEEYVTDLHPYNGILVLRYLESNYNYVLLETKAPKNYKLPNGRNAETRFTVTNTTVSVEEVDVPNKPTSLLIRKYDNNGNLLEGAEFKVYKGLTCDPNLSASKQPKELLNLKTIRDGVYENAPEYDTDTIKTCTNTEDFNCSDIPINKDTKLTYTDYLGSWADFSLSTNNKNEKIELQAGEALIQYLEYDNCYIIEEVKAPKGYSLPKNIEDRFTMVTITPSDDVADTYKELVNKPTIFTFYKFDEYNQLLDGAEFKLQKLDSNKKYQDLTVVREETENGLYYRVDETTDNKVITTINGSASVYYLGKGQYRILETKPAEGKELSKNPNVATFFVDDNGNVYGNSTIVNKPKTEKFAIKASDSAELVVNIQTGQTIIRYGLLISILVAIITGLIILKKKTK